MFAVRIKEPIKNLGNKGAINKWILNKNKRRIIKQLRGYSLIA
jgi:hypothetical protein